MIFITSFDMLNYFMITNFVFSSFFTLNWNFLPKDPVCLFADRCLRGQTISGSPLRLLSSFSSCRLISSLVISYTTSHLNSFPAETTGDVAVKATFGRSYAVEMRLLSGVSLAKSGGAMYCFSEERMTGYYIGNFFLSIDGVKRLKSKPFNISLLFLSFSFLFASKLLLYKLTNYYINNIAIS